MPEGGRAIPVLHGLVLAGGRSQRLGQDKAAIMFRGETLLSRSVRLLGEILGDVQVAVRPDQVTDSLRRHYALVTDLYDGRGPAAGLLAAHRRRPAAAWLVLACDMPGVTSGMLAELVARRDPGRPATAFRNAADGLPEPLCAIYEPATLARFLRQVEEGGDPSPRNWLAAAAPLLLDESRDGVLGSINTPEDLDRLAADGRTG